MKNTQSTLSDARLDYEYQTVKPDDIEFERITSEEEITKRPSTYEINTYPADFYT